MIGFRVSFYNALPVKLTTHICWDFILHESHSPEKYLSHAESGFPFSLTANFCQQPVLNIISMLMTCQLPTLDGSHRSIDKTITQYRLILYKAVRLPLSARGLNAQSLVLLLVALKLYSAFLSVHQPFKSILTLLMVLFISRSVKVQNKCHSTHFSLPAVTRSRACFHIMRPRKNNRKFSEYRAAISTTHS